MTVPEQNYRILVNHPVYVGGMGQEPVEIDVSIGRPDFRTTDGVLVWIERKTIRTRFLNAAGEQVGPWHANFVPAIIWAAAQGWRDPSAPDWLNDAVIAEVARGGAEPQEGQPGWETLR